MNSSRRLNVDEAIVFSLAKDIRLHHQVELKTNLRRVEYPHVLGQAHGFDELIIRQLRVALEQSVQYAGVLFLIFFGMHTKAQSLEHSCDEFFVRENILGRMISRLANFELRRTRFLSGSVGDGGRNLEDLVENAGEIFIVGGDSLVLSLTIRVDQLDEHLSLVGKVALAPEQTKEAKRLTLDMVIFTARQKFEQVSHRSALRELTLPCSRLELAFKIHVGVKRLLIFHNEVVKDTNEYSVEREAILEGDKRILELLEVLQR